ncbi:MAG: 3-hydroxyacyl-CoA dehydrogenase NAD-binding domain-containing protein [Vicinamibacteraceae bacterium]
MSSAAETSAASGVRRVGVVGAGTMGLGIAQVFAQAGFDVLLHDTSTAALDRARQGIEKSLGKFVEKGKLTAENRDATLARLTLADALEALAAVDLAVEAIVESVDAKRTLFTALDRLTPPATLLASNTSSISITVLGATTRRADRVFGLHFMNPVPLMPLVELVRGQVTSDATMAAGLALTRALGKTGIEAADYPGFIANRILMPMINEAVFALMEGVGTAAAIDGVMKLGMNHPMGPLTLADFIGLDVCVAILDVLHDGLGDPKYRACPLLRRLVAAGQLGRKSGQGFYAYGGGSPQEPPRAAP